MATKTIMVTYPANQVNEPVMQTFMEWALQGGVTVNIRGGSANDGSAIFVLRLDCNNPAMLSAADEWWRKKGATVEDVPTN